MANDANVTYQTSVTEAVRARLESRMIAEAIKEVESLLRATQQATTG